MEQVNTNANSNQNNKPKTRFTPRELIHHHMENPDEPITDADIENLYLGERESNIYNNPMLIKPVNGDMHANENTDSTKAHTILTSYTVSDK